MSLTRRDWTARLERTAQEIARQRRMLLSLHRPAGEDYRRLVKKYEREWSKFKAVYGITPLIAREYEIERLLKVVEAANTIRTRGILCKGMKGPRPTQAVMVEVVDFNALKTALADLKKGRTP